MHTGSIVDFYDDPAGSVLTEKVAHAQLPDYIKTAELLSDAARAQLPDDVFALVAFDSGEKLRKYACTDKGNTALSVIYFMENRHKLPEEAQKVAAANLVTACGWHELHAPLALQKLARIRDKARDFVLSAVGPAAVKGQMLFNKSTPAAVKAGLVASTAVPLAAAGNAGYIIGKYRSKKQKEKSADVTGTEIMPNSVDPQEADEETTTKTSGARLDALKGAIKGGYARGERMKPFVESAGKGKSLADRAAALVGVLGPKKALAIAGGATAGVGAVGGGAYALGRHQGKKAKEKKAGVLRPYVDITGKQAPVRFEKRAHSHFCLVKQGQGRFPIDDYGQVMEATQWFGEHNTSLHPSERRDYCIKLAARADQLGIQVTDQIRKYAGQDFAPDGEVKVAVCGRMQFWADDSAERDMLDGLMNKYASVPPDVFCEALRQFDEATGMDHLWDDQIYDPWYSTFGFTKVATWSWTHGNDRLTDEQLVRGVGVSFDALRENFGEEMAVELKKAPQKIFDSLPLDSKRIIARMVTDST